MKSVTIASGKGGTGKTTLTAVLAWMAARELGVTLADADVEASNLPLALQVHSQTCTAFQSGGQAQISEADCSGCGLCQEVCRFEAILRPQPEVFRVDSLSCEGCGHCARVCPTGAIKMLPTCIGEACQGQCRTGPIAFGQLTPGQDLSGRLVTEVRRLGLEAAQEKGSDLLLIDGPPGTGCPLIAALASTDLVLAVTEPTLSGAHDLERLVQVSARFRIPVRVVLNKADLAPEGARNLRETCQARGLPIWAEIPYDPVFAGTLQAMSAGPRFQPRTDSAAWIAAGEVWKALVRELDLPAKLVARQET